MICPARVQAVRRHVTPGQVAREIEVASFLIGDGNLHDRDPGGVRIELQGDHGILQGHHHQAVVGRHVFDDLLDEGDQEGDVRG